MWCTIIHCRYIAVCSNMCSMVRRNCILDVACIFKLLHLCIPVWNKSDRTCCKEVSCHEADACTTARKCPIMKLMHAQLLHATSSNASPASHLTLYSIIVKKKQLWSQVGKPCRLDAGRHQAGYTCNIFHLIIFIIVLAGAMVTNWCSLWHSLVCANSFQLCAIISAFPFHHECNSSLVPWRQLCRPSVLDEHRVLSFYPSDLSNLLHTDTLQKRLATLQRACYTASTCVDHFIS